MEQPGFSLFQGGDSIHVDARAAEEEAEELMDRKRRNNELGQVIQNAFDDLLEDDDETMDNSYRSGTSYQSQAAAETERFKSNNLENADENAIYRLRTELQSKTNELVHVNKVLNEERQTTKKQIGDLTKQLALAEAERERMQMIKNQTHELLVESKTKICELDDLVLKLRERNRALEEEKGRLTVELENARILLNDSQMKCHMMEKEIGRGAGVGNAIHSRNQDAAFKQMTERNNAQTEMLQQQIDNFRDKLDARDVELRTWEAKYRDLQKTREGMLIEKSDTINGLTERLEKAQRQCQELLARQSEDRPSARTEAENAQLRGKVSGLEQHIDDLQKTTDGLLKQLDRHRRQQEDFGNVMESTPHVRKKPHLAMQGLEETDELAAEVAALKREVADKATEIKNLIITENELRQKLQLVDGKREHEPLNTSGCGDCRVTRCQLDELMAMNKNLSESNADLQEMNKRIMVTQEEDNRLVVQKLQELKLLQQVLADQKRTIEALEREKGEMLEKFKHERQKMKEISDNSVKCMQQMRQATEIEVKNMQLQNDCMGYLKNLKGLRAASQYLDGVTECRSTSTGTSPSRKTYCDRSVMVSTPSDLSTSATNTECTTATTTTTDLTSPQRTAIIEEYAKLSAVEIKRVEEKYQQQLVSTQEELAEYQRELEVLRRTYTDETRMFKEAILAEREEYELLLVEKEREIEELQTQVAMLQHKSARNEKEDQLLDSLERELKKKQEEIDEERHSMQVWRNQWKEERKQLLTIEEHLKKEMAVLRENWKSAKSTAANYKKYTEEKDKFINREIERMRMQYEGVIEKLRHKCIKADQKANKGSV